MKTRAVSLGNIAGANFDGPAVFVGDLETNGAMVVAVGDFGTLGNVNMQTSDDGVTFVSNRNFEMGSNGQPAIPLNAVSAGAGVGPSLMMGQYQYIRMQSDPSFNGDLNLTLYAKPHRTHP